MEQPKGFEYFKHFKKEEAQSEIFGYFVFNYKCNDYGTGLIPKGQQLLVIRILTTRNIFTTKK